MDTQESKIFQTELTVTIQSPENIAQIIEYPVKYDNQKDEVMSYMLLYRNFGTFAIGHGCSANWEPPNHDNRVSSIKSEFIPTYEMPLITPSVQKKDGFTKLEISMEELANTNNFSSLEELLDLYKEWIEEKKQTPVKNNFTKTKNAHVESCTKAYDRMVNGLNFIKSNADALSAFQLANKAILLQQNASVTKRNYNIQKDK